MAGEHTINPMAGEHTSLHGDGRDGTGLQVHALCYLLLCDPTSRKIDLCDPSGLHHQTTVRGPN